MNPLALLQHWKLIAVALLVAALGAQSYRLQGAQGRVAVLEEREQAQQREQALRELQALRNKERTDEEYDAAIRRAVAVKLRGIKPTVIITRVEAPARSADSAAECVSRGELDQVVAEFSRRHGEELDRVTAEFSRRHREGAERISRQGEIIAAAYRACRAFSMNDSTEAAK